MKKKNLGAFIILASLGLAACSADTPSTSSSFSSTSRK